MNTVIVSRKQVGRWCSYLGASFVLLGTLAMIWGNGISVAVIALWLGGVVGLALWAYFLPTEFKDFISGRQTRQGTGAFFGTLVLIGIVAVTYVLAQRAVLTLDMTATRAYSINSTSLSIIEAVKQGGRRVEITGFYTPRTLTNREIDDQYFRLYAAASDGFISVRYFDPQQTPAVAQSFDVTQDPAIFLSYLNDDGTVNRETSIPVLLEDGGEQEQAVTTALVRLIITGNTVVYFDTSHNGIRDVDMPTDPKPEGMSQLNENLKQLGFITAPLDLAQVALNGGTVPQDASVVILPRPTTEFSAQEVAVLEQYWQRGGRVLVLADIQFSESPFLAFDSPLNNALWRLFGVRARDAAIVDRAASTQTLLDLLPGGIFPMTSLANNIDQRDSQMRFSIVRALELNVDPPPNVSNGRVIVSSPESYAETDLARLARDNTYEYDQAADIGGAQDYMLWAEWDFNPNAPAARVILFGDGDFARNAFFENYVGNRQILTNSITWLTGYGENVVFTPSAIAEGAAAAPILPLTSAVLNSIAVVTVVILPFGMLVAGFVVWRRRINQQ
jgi:hypothetical protein